MMFLHNVLWRHQLRLKAFMVMMMWGLNVLGCPADILGTNCNKLLKLKINEGGVVGERGGGGGGSLWTPSSGFIPPHKTVGLSSLLIFRSHSEDDSAALDMGTFSLSLLHTSCNFGPRQYVLRDNLVLYKTNHTYYTKDIPVHYFLLFTFNCLTPMWP